MVHWLLNTALFTIIQYQMFNNFMIYFQRKFFLWWKQYINHERGQLFRWLTVNDLWINDNDSPNKRYHQQEKKWLFDWLNVYCFTSHSIFFPSLFRWYIRHMLGAYSPGAWRNISCHTSYDTLTQSNPKERPI